LLDAEDVDVIVPTPMLEEVSKLDPEARPIIEDLRRVGLYVKDTVIADALRQAGE
jgi:hypothetical protein